jgi:type I restriction enzyme, R subunit
VSTNFAHLRCYDQQLFRLGVLAERYFPEDPNTALIKPRQLGERLAQQVASRFGVFTSLEESQLALIRRLELDGLIEREVAGLFHDLRKNGNAATHGLHGDHASALSALKIAWQLGVWFHRSFGDSEFRSGPFRPQLLVTPLRPDCARGVHPALPARWHQGLIGLQRRSASL